MTKKKTKKKNNSPISRITNFFKDEKVKITIGGLLFIFTFLLLLSFVSFLFTWKQDQSKLDIEFFKFIFNSDIVVENWMGKIGAKLSYIFIHNWFGIASFSFIYIFGIFSLYFFNFKPVSISKSIKYSIIITIWLSITMGYLFANKYFMLGGAHGYFISKWTNSVVGKTGTLAIILLTAFVFIIFVFKNSLNYIKSIFNNNNKDIDKYDNNFDETTNNDNISQDNKTEIEITNVTLEEPIDKINSNDNYDINNNEDKKDTIPAVINKTETEQPETKEKINLEIEEIDDNPDNEIAEQISEIPEGDYDPTLDLSNYKIPPLDILVDHKVNDTQVSDEELQENSEKIVKTLSNYKIQIDKISATIGPTITLYEIVPAPGVRISKIKVLEDDIALSLAALGIRIIAPIPGKGTIGIEVPNKNPEIVSMKSVISSKKFQESKMELPLVFGKTISNEIFMLDLAKAPHILVAGATGQGKSVGINAILTSLLYKKHPSQVKFVLVDPKKVELSVYSKIERHFLAKIPDTDKAIITNPDNVISTLNSLTKEMDDRYKLLEGIARNIKEYNHKFIKRQLNPEKGHRFLPYIVVIIDEFADLIMVAGKEVEMPIARIAQLARAVGIHLIVATQRPSTNVITGIIKANFPTRISFKVTSMVDSRTILDHPGANNLIGRGDMLISNGSSMTRVQCAFIDTPEVEEISEYIGEQVGYPNAFLLPEPDAGINETSQGNKSENPNEKRDKLFADAARVVVSTQQGSTSGIQRRLSIGYARAGRIMDQLEAAGIVGPFKGSKAREVLFHDELSLEQFLQKLDDPESTIGRQ